MSKELELSLDLDYAADEIMPLIGFAQVLQGEDPTDEHGKNQPTIDWVIDVLNMIGIKPETIIKKAQAFKAKHAELIEDYEDRYSDESLRESANQMPEQEGHCTYCIAPHSANIPMDNIAPPTT